MTVVSANTVKELRDRTGVSMIACKKALEEVEGNIEKAVELLRKRGESVAAKRSGMATREGLVVAGSSAGRHALVEITAETDFTARNADFQAFADAVLACALATASQNTDALLASSGASLGGRTVAEATADIVGKIGENIAPRRISFLQQAPETTVTTYTHGGGRIGVLVELAHPGAETSAALSSLCHELCLQIAFSNPVAIDVSGIPAETIAKEKAILTEQAVQQGIAPERIDKVVEGKLGKVLKDIVLLEQPYIKDEKTSVARLLASKAAEVGASILTVRSFTRLQLGDEA